MKRIIAVILFSLIFSSNLAFAFSGARFFVLPKKAETQTINSVSNSKVMFVKDYCKIIIETVQNFQECGGLFSLPDAAKPQTLKAAETAKDFFINVQRNSFYKKAPLRSALNFCAASEGDFQNRPFGAAIFIISSLLLYIGLLRGFNSSANNINMVKIG